MANASHIEAVVMKHARAIEAYVTGDYDHEEGDWGVGGIARSIRAAITEAGAASADADAHGLDAEFAEIVHKDRRDDFAKLAMQALIAKVPLHDRLGEVGVHAPTVEDIHRVRQDIAQSAYDYADAMLAEREIPREKA